MFCFSNDEQTQLVKRLSYKSVRTWVQALDPMFCFVLKSQVLWHVVIILPLGKWKSEDPRGWLRSQSSRTSEYQVPGDNLLKNKQPNRKIINKIWWNIIEEGIYCWPPTSAHTGACTCAHTRVRTQQRAFFSLPPYSYSAFHFFASF